MIGCSFRKGSVSCFGASRVEQGADRPQVVRAVARRRSRRPARSRRRDGAGPGSTGPAGPGRLDAPGLRPRPRPSAALCGPSRRTWASSQAAPRSTPLIFSEAMCCRLRAEPARLVLDVDGDRLHAVVEDPHQPARPSGPRPRGPGTPAAPSSRPARPRRGRRGAPCGGPRGRMGTGPAAAAAARAARPRRSVCRPADGSCRGCACRPRSAPSRGGSGSAPPGWRSVRPFKAFSWT